MEDKQLPIQSDQTEILEKGVTKAIDSFQNQLDCSAFASINLFRISKQFRCLILTSPKPSLGFHYGSDDINVSFMKLHKCKIHKGGKLFELEHLWKTPERFVLVQDLVFFFQAPELKIIQYAGSPIIRRQVMFLDKDMQKPLAECLECDITVRENKLLTLNLCKVYVDSLISAIYDEATGLEYLQIEDASTPQVPRMPKIKTEINDTLAKRSTSINTSETEQSNPASLDDVKECSEWLIDFDNTPPLLTPALQADSQFGDHLRELLAVQVPKSAKISEHQEAALQTRKAGLEDLERTIAKRVAEVEARESAMDVRESSLQSSWARYVELNAAIEIEKENLKAERCAIEKQRFDNQAREISIVELENEAKELTANIQKRAQNLELLEKSNALEFESQRKLLKERGEDLNEREKLLLVDQSSLKIGVADVSFREHHVKKREGKVHFTEYAMIASTDAIKTRECSLDTRERAILARETALQEREDAVTRCKNALQDEKDNQWNFENRAKAELDERLEQEATRVVEMRDWELAVLEREQRVEAIEATLKLEQKLSMIA